MRARPAIVCSSFLAVVCLATEVLSGVTATLDSIDIQDLGNELLAIRDGNSASRIRLESREKIVWRQARGVVGAVLSDRRFFAISQQSPGWQQVRLQRGEGARAAVELGANVAWLVTPRRLVGFDGISGVLSEQRLRPQEGVIESGVGEHVGVVVTTRRVVGLASRFGKPVDHDFNVHESYESLKVLGTAATVRTSDRLLIFHGASGVWTDEDLPLQ